MSRSNYVLKTIGVCSLILAGSLSLRAQGVALEWAKQMNSDSANSMGQAITTDASGNVYVAGRFGGTVDFDPGTGIFNMTADGITDAFVSKLDAAGNLIWAKKMGSPSAEVDQASAIAVDIDGNVYTTGIYGGGADFDPGTGTFFLPYYGGWSDVFISKLDASGNFVWAKSINGTGAESASSIVLDNTGNIFISGGFGSNVDFDPGTGVFNMTTTEASGFVLKLDNTGAFVWAKQIGGAGNYLAGNLAVAPSGSIYLMGSVLDNSVDMDPGAGTFSVTPVGFIDACVLKLNSSGNFVWAKQMGGIFSLGFGIKVVLDEQENVLAGGVYVGSVDFDPGTSVYDLSSTGSEDIFLSKLDSAGNLIWAKTSAGAGSSIVEIYDLTTDVQGNVYTTGFFSSTVDFDPGTATANLTAPTTDAFLMKLDSAGSYRWSKQIAGSGQSLGRSINIDPSGNVYSTGNFKDTCDFDPNAAVSNMVSTTGKDAIYIHKMVCSDTSSSSLTIKTDCDGYVFNGVTYTQTGLYTITLPNIDGCDSTVLLNLEVDTFQVAFTVTGYVLTAAAPYTTYQWLLNGANIPGATSNTYTITQDGQYKLIGTNANGCTDTSDVYNVTNYTGIDDINNIAAQINVYPNPVRDMVFINAPLKTDLVLTDISGKIILQKREAKQISLEGLSPGIYFLRILDKNNHFLKAEKLVKEK
jgi:hypothetical protein